MSSSDPGTALAISLDGAAYTTAQGHALVRPCNLQLAAGQHLAIVGPNGAGKSTLLRLLAGTLKPSAGQVRWGGVDSTLVPAAARARTIAVLGQNDHADGRLRVTDYVGLGCLPHRNHLAPGQFAQAVAQALERCGLQRFAQRALGSLSGGERQRAHLARALAQQPGILLLDEPTNHLDPRATLELLEGIGSLGITVVAVLHDLALVPQWATQVAVVRAGRLVVCDTPERALTPHRLHEVFQVHAFYLPHPATERPILVMDTAAARVRPAAPRTGFFSTYEESLP